MKEDECRLWFGMVMVEVGSEEVYLCIVVFACLTGAFGEKQDSEQTAFCCSCDVPTVLSEITATHGSVTLRGIALRFRDALYLERHTSHLRQYYDTESIRYHRSVLAEDRNRRA